MRIQKGIALSATILLEFTCMTSANDMTAGVAVKDITPPTGWRMSGYFMERLNTGLHDPLLVKAVVFKQGQNAAAIAVCDLIGIPLSVSEPARKRASVRTGIPFSNIIVAATHTHTAPLYFGALREHFHGQAEFTQGRDPCEPIDYSAKLTSAVVQAIEEAQAEAKQVEISAGSVMQKPQISFNRRYHMRDGSVRFNPGQGNPEIVRPAGPIDPALDFLLLRRTGDSRPFAALTAFALHPDTTGGTEWSADYPYHLEATLRHHFGKDFVSVFGLGTCGDINDIDVSTNRRRGAKALGAMLGDTLVATQAELKLVTPVSLAIRSATVQAPLQHYGPERVTQARQDMARIGTPGFPFLEAVEAYKITDLQSRRGSTLPLEVQAIRLNQDVAIVAVPGELFAELGLLIKRSSPFRMTVVIELANDNPAYIPTVKAFQEGGYETINSRVRPTSGEMMVQAAINLLHGLARETSQ